MNPIILGRQVERGLKDLVRSTLNTTSLAFDGTVERFLDKPGNYIKGPWVSVAMPFKHAAEPGEDFEQPFADLPLHFAPYQHQLTAFERLSGANPRSTLLATGTGSGKTESYLWPIFEHCKVEKGRPGIKAILIYPMNALATDQSRRIARAIHEISSLKGVSAGIYADAEPRSPTDAMTEQDVITRRAAMWSNPPDILLTNYKMLDYLLLRGRDQPLWANNTPETLRFLVVDEMHTFDGAQGADLALLIRRLKYRLGTPERHLTCIASSATLGSGEEVVTELRTYAQTIFGEKFDDDSVVRETRQTPDEVFPTPEYFEWPDVNEVDVALESSLGLSQAETARQLAICLFPSQSDQDLTALHGGNPETSQWRLLLGRLLLEHLGTQRVLRIIAENSGPVDLATIAEKLDKVKALKGWSFEARVHLSELIISLISWARSGSDSSLQPLFGVRLQIWVREMSRMVAKLPRWTSNQERTEVELIHAHDMDYRDLEYVLPIVNCARCGTTAHLGRQSAQGLGLWASLPDLYEEFFDGSSSRIRLIYHEFISGKASKLSQKNVITGVMDADSLDFSPGEHEQYLEAGSHSPVWLYNPTDDMGRFDRTCPACGHAHGLLLFGIRAARLTAALANTIYASEHNEEKQQDKPRLLMFSDSVQDAAQRAAVAEIRNTGSVIRKSLYRAIGSSPGNEISLADVIDAVPESELLRLGNEAFVSTYIARNQIWRDPYQTLSRVDQLPSDKRFIQHVKQRLGWEYFSDLTYRSHTSQTLEVAGIAVAEVSPKLIRNVAKKLPGQLANALSGSFTMDESTAGRFLSGLLQQMRRRGAVGHEYIVRGMAASPLNIGGPNYFAASFSMGFGKTRALPTPDHRKASAPLPVTLKASVNGYESLLRDHSTNWYRDWADKFFIPISIEMVSQYDIMFDVTMRWLEAEDVVRRIDRPNPSYEHGFIIEPSAITVTDRVVHLKCDNCRRQEIALEENAYAVGSPCSRIGCDGTLAEMTPKISESTANLLATDRNHRVVGREHTGLLDAEERREIETGFIEKETPWAPNLISATPTLEMGIDIGDLSTVLLCSVPPEEANYVQRVGRSGRRDGNSLNLTIATARPHDLQFWEEPISMLAGEVHPPGVYIGAISVLLRQAAAFSLDCLVASGAVTDDYGKVRGALRQLEESRGDGFPLDWFHYLGREGTTLAVDFLAILPTEVASRPEISDRITSYMTARDDRSLTWHIQTTFDETASERAELVALRKELDAETKRVKRREHEMTPEAFEERLAEIKRNKGEINHAIRKGIDDVAVLRFLTDKGVLPNYAFPEQGIKLKSIVIRQPESGKREENGENLRTYEYVRPASSALSEFAPGQTFYAKGREVVIERLDLSKQDLSTWQFCQNCSHVELQSATEMTTNCPRCDDDMWDDVGSKHEAVELKTVIAVTSEHKAAIRDSDDRQEKHYDRTMVPFYEQSEIEIAWYAEGGIGDIPFGFEFIAPCTFRDFNFGVRASAPVGPRIAGQIRKSWPFKLCRHCGIVQKRQHGDDDAGQHQPRCKVLRTDSEPDRNTWETEVFLMRKFETESIRIVVPVVGEASDDDIKSFVAAINLGMRKYFAGKVDHIRSTVVEAQLDGLTTVRSLFLYDAIPGGSGYLRQLAKHPNTMRAVIEQSAEALKTCPCVEQDKTGCFRCVKSYRSQFGPGEPDRDTALHMMESILANWGDLTLTSEGIDTRIRNYLVETELERRFLETLGKKFGEECLTPQVLEGGGRGFILKIENGPHAYFWSIETQVQIDRRFKDLPRKRIDFLFSPVGGLKAKPIVVEMDGLKYHHDTVDDDLTIRIQMIRSGHVRVWTLGWHDLEPTVRADVQNPFSEERLGTALTGLLAKLLSNPDMEDLIPEVGLLQGGTSLEGLFHYLTKPNSELSPAVSVLTRMIIGLGQEIDSLPRIASLIDDSRSFLEEGNSFGFVTDRNLDLYLAVKKKSPQLWREEVEDCRILLRGTLPDVSTDPSDTPGYSDAWRGLWRLVNFMQDVRGFHIEFEGVDTIFAPDVTTTGTGSEDGAWLEVFTLVDEGFRALIESLQAADVAPPDMLGADITQDGEVVGMIEIGWSDIKFAVCESRFNTPDWDLIAFNPEENESVTEITTTIIQKIEEASS